MSKQEFVTRTLTGILIVGVTLAAIIFSPYTYLALLCTIAFIGTAEFFRLDQVSPRVLLVNLLALLFSLIIAIAGYFLLKQESPVILIIILPVMISFIVALQLLYINAPSELVIKGKSIYAAASYIVLPLLCGTLFLMGEYSYRYVLVPVILIWVNDIGAYLFGSRWGTKKIMPSISPGKSMQGTIGGAFVALLTTFIMWRLWPDMHLFYLVSLGLITPLLALGGDLWESALKRNAGVKDSGTILPGHGGILDRYDSFLFLLPVAALAYYIFVL